MFTGLIEARGRVAAAGRGTLSIRTPWTGLRRGESLSVNGVCLTVTGGRGKRVDLDVVPETLSKTTLGRLKPGESVNLERAMRLSDRIGGHFVTGHVDGVGRVAAVRAEATGKRLEVKAPAACRPYLAPKGSVAVDGVSLTVVDAADGVFSVALIPETLERTTLGRAKSGDEVNIEIDMIAKYVAQWFVARASAREPALKGGPQFPEGTLAQMAEEGYL